jgi:cyclopropane-fatty-acyl-phospholipid synthase
VRFCDYRDISGTYDRIVSIEMIEAVGEDNWPDYFATLSRCLVPGGSAVVQAITIADSIFEGYRRKADFIQRYIFPGGMLPTETRMDAEAHNAGLSYGAVETFGQSYAHTLIAWRNRFEAAWPQLQKLGFDERFRRMWTYYLTYCEAGFERGTVDVGLYRFKKP